MVKPIEEPWIVRRLIASASIAAMVAAAACSDSTGAKVNAASQLAFSAASPFTAATATAAATVVPVTKNGHTLDLSTVSVTLTRAELKRVHTDVCRDDEDDDDQGDDRHGDSSKKSGNDACQSVKVGPTTVELPLTGNVVTVPADTLPAGTFREIEVRIAQVHLTGTFDTKAFDVTIPVKVKTEIEFATPLVVTAGTPTSITVNLSVADWFVNADGSLVDPSAVSTSPTLLAQLQTRIARALRAFEDRDHDGHDDHRRGHDD